MTDIDHLKNLLTDAGYEFEVGGHEGTYTVSIQVPIPDEELPEELRRFAWSPDQVERAIWKGNADKNTFNGANFEIALREYAGDIMQKDPETIELEKTMLDVRNMDELLAYQMKRQAIWERICARPEIVAWEEQLDKLL